MIRHNGIVIDRGNRTITHAYHTEHFVTRKQAGRDYVPTYKFDTFCHLILAQQTRYQLFTRIFGDCEDGGPEMGPAMWDIRFNQWQKVFDRLVLQLRREKIAGIIHYRLQPYVV